MWDLFMSFFWRECRNTLARGLIVVFFVVVFFVVVLLGALEVGVEGFDDVVGELLGFLVFLQVVEGGAYAVDGVELIGGRDEDTVGH